MEVLFVRVLAEDKSRMAVCGKAGTGLAPGFRCARSDDLLNALSPAWRTEDGKSLSRAREYDCTATATHGMVYGGLAHSAHQISAIAGQIVADMSHARITARAGSRSLDIGPRSHLSDPARHLAFRLMRPVAGFRCPVWFAAQGVSTIVGLSLTERLLFGSPPAGSVGARGLLGTKTFTKPSNATESVIRAPFRGGSLVILGTTHWNYVHGNLQLFMSLGRSAATSLGFLHHRLPRLRASEKVIRLNGTFCGLDNSLQDRSARYPVCGHVPIESGAGHRYLFGEI